MLILSSCSGGRDSPIEAVVPVDPGPVAGAVGAATLSWVAPTQNVDETPLLDLSGFTVYYGTISGEYNYDVPIDNPSINVYIVEGLTSGTTYYFAVSAETESGLSSELSNEVMKKIE